MKSLFLAEQTWRKMSSASATGHTGRILKCRQCDLAACVPVVSDGSQGAIRCSPVLPGLTCSASLEIGQ